MSENYSISYRDYEEDYAEELYSMVDNEDYYYDVDEEKDYKYDADVENENSNIDNCDSNSEVFLDSFCSELNKDKSKEE